MAIIAKEKSSGVPQVPEGVYIGTCVWVIDLGDQWSEIYQKTQRKVMLTWEIAGETVEIDGEQKPRIISKEYTLSLSKKATLRQHLEAWRGRRFSDEELKAFDLINILGTNCQIQIQHNENGYADVASIMKVPNGFSLKNQDADTIYFDWEDPRCFDLFENIPDWIINKIKKSYTYAEKTNTASPDDYQEIDDFDDLPF